MAVIAAVSARGQTVQAAGGTSPATPEAVPRPWDPALATTPAAVTSGLKEKKIFLIDVRTQAAYEQYRIPGALNIPLHAIRTKAYLKTKPVVLVNEGFGVSALAQTCRTLNRGGFNAAILAGGLTAWKQKGGPLTGDPFAMHQMNRVSPRLFDLEKRYAPLVLIDASHAVDARDGSLMPAARQIKLPGAQKEIEALKKMIRAERSDPFARLLVFTTTGKENDRIQRRLDQAGIQSVFFLEGGLQAHANHIQQTQLARRSKEERKVTTGGCQSCTQNN